MFRLKSLLASFVMVLTVAAANANTISNFDVSGTVYVYLAIYVSGYETTSISGAYQFSGTLTVDVTAGAVTAVDIAVDGLAPDFTTFGPSQSLPGSIVFDHPPGWQIDVGNGVIPIVLDFETTAPGSLIGFDGGSIFGGAIAGGGQCSPDGSCSSFGSAVQSGNVTAATPLPATLPLFATGLGVMGLFARGRKRKGAGSIQSPNQSCQSDSERPPRGGLCLF
jgi:hypothetical protein